MQTDALSAVAESEARLRLAIEAAAIGIWPWDCRTDAVYWSPECFDIMGVRAWGGTRDDFARRIHPADAETLWETVEAAIGARTQFRHEFRIIRGDGSIRWVINIGKAEYADDGAPTRMLGVIQDITERVEAHQALSEAEREKGMLLLVVAHELRNFLAPIPASVTIIRHEAATAQQREYALKTISSNAELLRRLVDELLDVGKLAQGRFVLELERTSLQEILRTALEAASAKLSASDHRVTVSLPDDDIHLQADKLRLCQAFVNVFTNAAKYTPAGGFIDISAAREDNCAVVRVRDTGVGFSLDQRKEIFELFRQGSDSNPGIGVGLYLTRAFVELHGGTVNAHSDGVGKGAHFEFRLPVDSREGMPAAVST